MKPCFTFLTIVLLSIINFSCNKDKKADPQTALTDCPANSNCTYNFTEKADFKVPNQLVSGDNRIFYYSSVNTKLCSATTQLYFKTSLSNSDFTISGAQIAAGTALYNFSCPCCDYIGLTAIGGEIKGKKVQTGKWLVNATIILGNSQSKAVVDTIRINQYFMAKALDN